MKNLKHIYYFSGLIIVLSFILAGCASQQAAGGNGNNNQNAQGQQNQTATEQSANARNADRGQFGGPNGNFTAASSSDLVIGQKIMVMGTSNSDGSVSASQIIIGNANTDFSTSTFFRSFSGGENATSTDGNPPARQFRQGQTGQTGQNGAQPDFSRFQNMTDAERQQLRDQMAANGGGFRQGGGSANGGTRQFTRAGGAGASRLAGEIIDLDATSFTLKLDEGGSKLVFYSPSTMVNKISEITNGADSGMPPTP